MPRMPASGLLRMEYSLQRFRLITKCGSCTCVDGLHLYRKLQNPKRYTVNPNNFKGGLTSPFFMICCPLHVDVKKLKVPLGSLWILGKYRKGIGVPFMDYVGIMACPLAWLLVLVSFCGTSPESREEGQQVVRRITEEHCNDCIPPSDSVGSPYVPPDIIIPYDRKCQKGIPSKT